MRKRNQRKPLPHTPTTLDHVHRAICIITMFLVVGLFIYVLNLTNTISDAIVRREKDFIEIKDRVKATESLLSELNKSSVDRFNSINSINTDITKLKAQLEIIDTRLTGKEDKPTTRP